MDQHRLMLRVANRAFEAWDPAFGTLVIVNAGARLRVRQVVFDVRRDVSLPPIKRGVQFDFGDSLCCAEFDRFEENTSALAPVEADSR